MALTYNESPSMGMSPSKCRRTTDTYIHVQFNQIDVESSKILLFLCHYLEEFFAQG